MTEQMNIIDYCNHHKIKTLPIKLEVKDKKKRYLSKQEGRFEDGRYNHKMTDFNEYTFNQCKTLTELSFPHPTSKSADSSLRRAVGRSPDGNHAAPAARRGAWTRLVTHIHYPKKLRVPSDACGACLAPAARCPIMPPQRH